MFRRCIVSMRVTEVLFTLQGYWCSRMIAAVAECFSALKSSRKKIPCCVFNKYGYIRI